MVVVVRLVSCVEGGCWRFRTVHERGPRGRGITLSRKDSAEAQQPVRAGFAGRCGGPDVHHVFIETPLCAANISELI